MDMCPNVSESVEAEWFKTQWQTTAVDPSTGNQEVDTSLILPLVVGCDVDSKPYLMLLSSMQPKPIKGFEAISVQTGIRQGVDSERWSLTFTLLDWGLLRAFAELCAALVERVRHAETEQEALRLVYATMDQWRRLLKGASNDEQLRMLRATIAELVAAGTICDFTGKDIEEVCDNWTGPYQAPQDFIFEDDKTAYEVKSSHSSTRMLTISSAEQLDDIRLNHLSLIDVTLESVPKTKQSAVNLSCVIDILRSRSGVPSMVTESIETRLDAIRLSPYSRFVAESYFHVERACIYDVDPGFPRIIADQVPSDIANLTYELRLTDIQPFCTQIIDSPLKQETV